MNSPNQESPMQLPEKVWITVETVQYGGETDSYLSVNDPAELSPGAMPYVPEALLAAARAEAFEEAADIVVADASGRRDACDRLRTKAQLAREGREPEGGGK